MGRKRLTRKQREDLFNDHGGRCWRCRQAIDPVHDRWHVGHIIGLACGGDDTLGNMAPEHSRCNLEHASQVEVAVAAKIKRVRQHHHGIRKRSKFANSREGPYKTKIGGRTVRR